MAAISIAGSATAQSLFEKLVMPGALTKAHEKYEKSCNKCHTPFRRETQTSLCLDCHDKVAADRKNTSGFHGKNQHAKSRECRQCHSEHKGADADIIGLDTDTFNHRETDFLLVGKHMGAPCASCHKPKEAYRKAPGECHACHGKDDPHKERLGKNCQSCHNEKNWTETKPFDHSKTKFPLTDSHLRVTCDKCHAGEAYKNVPTKCSGCHSVQDVHKGEFGARCEACHKPSKWKTASFDHDKATKFPLRGGHKTAKCESCHKGNLYSEKLPVACVGCHGKQDPHKSSLGTRCAKCHNENGWHAQVAFDHDLTRFPLIGLHAAVGCATCHRSKNYKDAPSRCAACHSDNVHKGRIGNDCGRCHSPNGWRRWTFDHAKDARYPLTGAHAALDCHGCHKTPSASRVAAPTTCFGCHSGDDVHHGSFGTACETCHTTDSFRRPRFQR